MSVTAPETYADWTLVPSHVDAEALHDFSIVFLSGGWPEDLRRLLAGLRKHCSHLDYEIVGAANNSAEVAEALDEEGLSGIAFSQHVGYGGGMNALLRRALGRIVVTADTSIEPTGDFLTPIRDVLFNRTVGIVGKWGLLSHDLRDFHEETGGEVDAMQGYLAAFRRDELASLSLFYDPKYRFYRHADIDFSLRWRDAGFRIVAIDLPLERHSHREWDALSEDQRKSRSRDNHARLMRAWRDRTDLLTGRAPHHHH